VTLFVSPRLALQRVAAAGRQDFVASVGSQPFFTEAQYLYAFVQKVKNIFGKT